MRQLERALLDLTERAERLPLDVLIHRVEVQLTLEGGLPVNTDAPAPPGTIQIPSEHQHTSLRRRRAWAFAAAFVLIIATIGIAALALRSDNLLLTDEPVPPMTPEVATSNPDVSEMAPIAASGRWEWMEIDEPWVASTIDVAPLPGGGFVVAATDEWSVLWSPDGIEWRDADPERQVAVLPLTPVFDGSRPQVVTAIGDRVAVLDSNLFGIRIGDFETQSWDSIEFDTSDLVGEIGLLMLASNNEQLVVIGFEDNYGATQSTKCGDTQSAREVSYTVSLPEETQYFAWVVDPRSGDVERHPLPARHDAVAEWWTAARVCRESYGSMAWFKDQWFLNLGDLVLVSPAGITWTQVPNSSPTSESSPFVLFKATLIAGPDTLIARGCGMACGLAYSETGVGDWIEIPEPVTDWVAYSDTIGYVSVGEYGESAAPGISVSSDGRHFTMAKITGQHGGLGTAELAASGNRVFGINEFGTAYLLIYTEPDELGG